MKEGCDPHDTGVEPQPVVLLDDGGVIAVAKPSGLPTQAPPGVASVETWLRGRLAPGAYVGVPHRLDRAVSGVLLLAVTPRAARKLSRQFERREIEKEYLALLAGPGTAGIAAAGDTEWLDALVKIPDQPRARIATAAEPGARDAVTRVCVVAWAADALLVRLEPRTGRMHQLRVQAASRGAPILGDALYGGQAFRFVGGPAPTPRQSPIALHAWRIRFVDPATGRVVRVDAPLPEAWSADVRARVAAMS